MKAQQMAMRSIWVAIGSLFMIATVFLAASIPRANGVMVLLPRSEPCPYGQCGDNRRFLMTVERFGVRMRSYGHPDTLIPYGSGEISVRLDQDFHSITEKVLWVIGAKGVRTEDILRAIAEVKTGHPEIRVALFTEKSLPRGNERVVYRRE
jgi:hypothetical protein